MNSAEELLCDFPLADTVCVLDDTEIVALLKRAEMLTHQALAAAQRSGLSPSALSHMEILSDVTAECIDVVTAPPREVNTSEKALETIIASAGMMADETKTSTAAELAAGPEGAATSLEIETPAAAPGETASEDAGGHTLALVASLCFFAMVVVPALILLICSVFGFIIARCEGWAFAIGFMYFAGNVTGLGEPLTNNSPKSPVGTVVDIVVSCWCLIFAGAAIGVTAQCKVMERLQDALPLEGWRGAVVLLVLVPGFVMLAAVVIAALLAACEDWSIAVGFRYMISAMCGLGNPLTERTPQSPAGRLIAIVCASWQMAIGGTVVGLTGAVPWLERALRAMEAEFTKRL